MRESLKAAVRSAVLRLLDPLVKWLLEAGMGVGDLLPLVKIAYVRAAREQGRRSSGELKRPNASRISVVTGLTRADRKSTRLNSSHRCISYAVFCLKKKKKKIKRNLYA